MNDQDHDDAVDIAESHVIRVDSDEPDPSKAVQIEARKVERTESNDTDEFNSRSMKKRFERFGRKIESRLRAQFDQDRANEMAEHQRELSALREQVDSIRGRNSDVSQFDDPDHETVMAKLQQDLEEAAERGDSKKQAEIARKMSRLEAEHMQKLTMKQLHAIGKEQQAKNAGGDQGERRASAASDANRPTPAGQRWIDSQDWWGDPEFKHEQQSIIDIHNRMLREGSDSSDPKHYERLGRIAKKRYPMLQIETPLSRSVDDDFDLDEDIEPAKPARRVAAPPSAGGEGASGKRSVRGQITLTADQIRTMQAVGMNPRNPIHVQEYVKSIREMQNSGGN